MVTRSTVGLRADKGWLPLIMFAIVGFVLGAGVVFIVAIHGMWQGQAFRHYAPSLYILAGLAGSVAVEVLGNLFAWASDVIEEEYLDGTEK